MSEKIKPAVWFWVIAILLTLWNAAGVFNYINQVTMSEEAFAALDERMQRMLEIRPAWGTGAFAVAVWGGFLACILLLTRKSWAIMLFYISLLGVVLSIVADFQTGESLTAAEIGFNTFIVIVSLLSIYFSRVSSRRNWLS